MPTREDVARLAGVSGASVARAFNSPEKVSRSTLEKIQAAAHALNYQPNYYGSVLRGKATRQIYAFCPDLVNPFFLHVYFGMEQYILEHDYQIFLTRTFNRNMIRQGRYDGFLFPVYNIADVIDGVHFLHDYHLPFVVSDFQNAKHKDFPSVSVDVEAAGYMASKHLFDLGHDNILFVAPQIDPKWVGIQSACAESNRHVSLMLIRGNDLDRNYFDLGARCAADIAAMKRVPTAVIAANDELAVGLVNQFTRLGFRIPQDISVIGFDDAYIAAYCNPPLTTVHYPQTRIGREMARILIDSLNGQDTLSHVVLPTEFVLRESTAPPRC